MEEESEKKTSTTCYQYLRYGVCAAGKLCYQEHPLPAFPKVVIFHHIYPDPDYCYFCLGRQNPKDDIEKKRIFNAFYQDLFLECRLFGEVLDILVAGNFSALLNGTAWVVFEDSDCAMACCARMNGRYYMGRKITTSLWNASRLSLIICNPPNRRCDKGFNCTYIHPIDPSQYIKDECFPRGPKGYFIPVKDNHSTETPPIVALIGKPQQENMREYKIGQMPS